MPCYEYLGLSRVNELCSAMSAIHRMAPETESIAARVQRIFANIISPAIAIPLDNLPTQDESPELLEEGELEVRNSEANAAFGRQIDDLVFAMMEESDYSDYSDDE